jgi:hypothetical protein
MQRGRERLPGGLDTLALKPAEHDLAPVADRLVIDYEGRDLFPGDGTLADLAADADLRVTTPVRADGFDPRGDDSLLDRLPAAAGRVLVAGHRAYLDDDEATRAVAPRLGEAAANAADPWVGTEGLERVALATGATQFELLSGDTERAVRALRAAGFGGEIAVYAPVVLADDTDSILDAVGEYVARRGAVSESLPADTPADARATGEARETLREAAAAYALAGDAATVRERAESLRAAGVDHVVGYPARGLDRFR